MLICPGCGGIAAAETLRTEVTREWIQEVYGFSDEDLEGVAVEEVAEALWWTRDEVQREFGSDSRGLLRNLKWGQKQLELHRTEHHYKHTGIYGNDGKGASVVYVRLTCYQFLTLPEQKSG